MTESCRLTNVIGGTGKTDLSATAEDAAAVKLVLAKLALAMLKMRALLTVPSKTVILRIYTV
jgi:hypothetical protein